jgi:nitroreductase
MENQCYNFDVDGNSDPWELCHPEKEHLFPRNGTEEEKMLFLLNFAILAPSSHNSQPWLFKINKSKGDSKSTINLYADPERTLHGID